LGFLEKNLRAAKAGSNFKAMDHLDYVEREAKENITFHLANLDALKKEAESTLNFLFLILSGAAAYTVQLIKDDNPFGALVLGTATAYLSLVAVYITQRCLTSGDVMPPTNEPDNLKLNEGQDLDALRKEELKNLHERIQFNRARNTLLGKRLNKSRLLICATPLVFLIAGLVVSLVAL
jgi:hypothetical protein